MAPHPLRWRHVIINTRSSWLHGDPRGFRSRHHRIHSSGDYKNPPPNGEHAGLHRFMRERSRATIRIPIELRVPILEAIVRRQQARNHRIVAGSIADEHGHLLVELPDHMPAMRDTVGQCKRVACAAVQHALPGSIWSADGEFKPVDSDSHFVRTYIYITEKQERDAATFDFVTDDFQTGRRDPGRRLRLRLRREGAASRE